MRLIIILQLHDLIYYSKKLNIKDEISHSVTISFNLLYFQLVISRASLFMILLPITTNLLCSIENLLLR